MLEKGFQNVMNNLLNAVVISQNRNVLFVNLAGVELLGASSAQEIIGQSLMNFIHPDFRPIANKRIQRIEENKQSVERIEGKFIRIDEKVVHVDVISFPTTFNGKPAVQTIFLDITEKKKAKQSLEEKENQLRTLLNAAPDFICFKDGEGRWIEVNEFGLRLFELQDVSYRGKKDSELAEYSPFYKEALLYCEKSDQDVWKQGNTMRKEERIPQQDGRNKVLDVIKVPLYYSDGSRKGLVIFGRDITNQKDEEEKHYESEAKYLELFNNTNDAILLAEIEKQSECFRFIDVNEPACRLSEYDRNELLSMELQDLLGQQHREELPEIKKELFEKKQLKREFIHVTKSGSKVPTEHSARIVHLNGKTMVLSVVRDISERKKMEEKMKYMAYYDELTGLPNKYFIQEYLEKIVCAPKSGQTIAVIFLDLDRFNLINDSRGHAFGNRVLQQVSERLTKCVNGKGTAARYGGDEFIIVLENTNKEAASQAAQKMIEECAQPFISGVDEFYTTASVGINLHVIDDHNNPLEKWDCQVIVDNLIKKANTAMHYAKGKGKNNYQFNTAALNDEVLRKTALENKLRKAIDKNELLLHYQPQVDLKTGTIIGMEALVRWEHPELGLVSPGEFIPLAEEAGLIGSIGEWVLETACRQTKVWQEKGLPFIRAAVNVSVQQFRNKNFVDKVANILRDTNLEPHYLELEVTESVMQNVEESAYVLNGLKELGVQIAIDDFGTGYSSLSILKHLPIDSLKIDKAFIDDINSSDETLVKTIIKMGHGLKFHLIAEGIESSEQLSFLKKKNCQLGQGYFFSKPLPAEDFEKLLYKFHLTI